MCDLVSAMLSDKIIALHFTLIIICTYHIIMRGAVNKNIETCVACLDVFLNLALLRAL